MKYTGTLTAYLTGMGWQHQQLINAVQAGNHEDVIDALSFYSGDMEENGWCKAGMAQVTVEIMDDEAIKLGMIDALKEQRTKVLAEAQAKATALDEKIQSLLAISYDAPTPAPVQPINDDGLPF